MTHESITALFGTTGDFIARKLQCGGHTVHAYMIDGLIASATAGETILKPLSGSRRDPCRSFMMPL